MVCWGRGTSLVGALTLALAATTGCGLDLGSADGRDTDDGAATTGADSTQGPADPSGETGDGDDASTGLTAGPDTGGDDGTGTGENDEDACDLDCGGEGWCENTDDGPACSCNDGYVSVGLGCLECTTVQGAQLDTLVPAVRASFSFTVNGELPQASQYDSASLALRNRVSGDVVPLGGTHELNATVLMVPGTYDVLYTFREGGTLPTNSAAVLRTIEIDSSADSYALDIPSSSLRGAISFAAAPPQDPTYDYGRLWLVNTTTGDRVRLGDTRDATYAVTVIPGEYDVHYEYREHTDTAPLNRNGYVTSISVSADQDNLADIVIETVAVSGAVLFDGSVVADPYDAGDLELLDVRTGDRFPLSDTEDGAYSTVVLAGTYDVIYTSRERGDATPGNVDAVVGELTLANEGIDATVDIDMDTVVLVGDFRLGNGAPPTDEFDDGIVSLQGKSGGTVSVGNTHDGSFSRRVLAGSYEVFYSQETASVSMPVNTHAQVGSLELPPNAGTVEQDVTIEVVEAFGTMTLGGIPAPDSAYDDGRLSLRNAETGDTVVLGNTRWGSYAARVVPGTYDILYANEFSETQLPVNGGAVLETGVLVDANNLNIDIDVPVSSLSGLIEIEGSAPSGAEGLGQLFLRDVQTDDEVFIGHTEAASFTKPLTDGLYIMEYRGVAAEGAELGTSLPANANAAFACFRIISE